MNKYTYYKVIQTFYGGWCDVDFHETDSQYFALDRALCKENLKAYRENVSVPIRVVKRRELKEVKP